MTEPRLQRLLGIEGAVRERLYLGLAADLKADNIAVNCLSPSRVVLTEGWQAGGGGMEIPPEMVEPPEAMANAAVLLAQQDASGITQAPSSAPEELAAKLLTASVRVCTWQHAARSRTASAHSPDRERARERSQNGVSTYRHARSPWTSSSWR